MEFLEGEIAARVPEARQAGTACPRHRPRTSRARSRTRWSPRTARASSIAISSPRTSSWFPIPSNRTASGPRCSTSGSRSSSMRPARRSAAGTPMTGTLIGTPRYMAPEQARAASQIDHRADLYSLGCILYEMIVGEAPFPKGGSGEVIAMHLFGEVTPPRERVPELSPELDAIIMQLLQKEPADRYASAAELSKALAGPAGGCATPGAGLRRRPPSPFARPSVETHVAASGCRFRRSGPHDPRSQLRAADHRRADRARDRRSGRGRDSRSAARCSGAADTGPARPGRYRCRSRRRRRRSPPPPVTDTAAR